MRLYPYGKTYSCAHNIVRGCVRVCVCTRKLLCHHFTYRYTLTYTQNAFILTILYIIHVAQTLFNPYKVRREQLQRHDYTVYANAWFLFFITCSYTRSPGHILVYARTRSRSSIKRIIVVVKIDFPIFPYATSVIIARIVIYSYYVLRDTCRNDELPRFRCATRKRVLQVLCTECRRVNSSWKIFRPLISKAHHVV